MAHLMVYTKIFGYKIFKVGGQSLKNAKILCLENLVLYSNKLIIISCTTVPYLASIYTVYNVLHIDVVACTHM